MLEIHDFINNPGIIACLSFLANPENVVGVKRCSINPKNSLRISMPTLRAIAKNNR